MNLTLSDLRVRDIRFPTSLEKHGSDAMHPDPDYSATYVELRCEESGAPVGHGLTFTCGRGNEVVVKAVEAFAPMLKGRSLSEVTASMGRFWRELASDGQLRWIGPEKGAVHLALAAVINAIWDLWAKSEGKPVWKLLVDLTPEQLVSCLDFRYVTDVLTPDDAIAMLEKQQSKRAEREAHVLKVGYPAYTTSVGWLGYSDEKIVRLCEEGRKAGWTHFKMKVGADLEDDLRRAKLIRDAIGPDCRLMMDANQRWDVGEAIAWMERLKELDPYWIEEPTSPDDALGHAAIARAIEPIRVATGEQCQNRVIFKQLMQAEAIRVCQLDFCRLGGLNEGLIVLLMANKFGIPVCPHAGGVGLCEYVQHISIFDYIAVTGSFEDRVVEYVDHLHEHFEDPVVIREGRYVPPKAPGFSITMKPASLDEHEFPGGPVWK
ncbi:MAG: L-fuconate dehydratase [Planctomycetota bacterium]